MCPLSEDPSTGENALDLLKALSELKVNLSILTSTRIGMTVNALRSGKKISGTKTVSLSLSTDVTLIVQKVQQGRRRDRPVQVADQDVEEVRPGVEREEGEEEGEGEGGEGEG